MTCTPSIVIVKLYCLQALNNRYTLEDENNCSKDCLWDGEFGGKSSRFEEGSELSAMFSGFQPDVYFRPHEVWEIRGAE
jgi:hypothetical protein